MKRIFCLVLATFFAIALLPSTLTFADGEKLVLNVSKHVFFNSNRAEFKSTDNANGNDNLLVASNGADGWQADKTFTDKDGTVITTDTLYGTGFNTPRNAVFTFNVPEGIEADQIAKATLSVTVKNVKQVTANNRLAVYGNSLHTSWTLADDMSIFGAETNDAGLGNLPLLGLTDPILTGNQTGESHSGETIHLSTIALAEYIREAIEEGYTELSFRYATSLGGIRIYDMNTAFPPTLTLEFGEITSVDVVNVFMDGDEVVNTSKLTTIGNQVVGTTFEYKGTPEPFITVGNDIYVYDAESSTLETTVTYNGGSEIRLVYKKFDTSLINEGNLVSEEGAWCWFADPRALHYENEEGTINNTYIGYIDVHGNVKATQYNHLTNEVSEVLIRSNLQPDDHNNPTFLVLPDERIMIFYSRHTDEPCFWYRVSTKKGDITTLGPEKRLATDHNTTYPSPFILEDDPDHIYLAWRGINWHPTIAKLDIPDENGDTQFAWGPHQIVQSTGARPYAKYASNGKDKIFMTYTTGHPDNENPNWVYFSQIDIATMTLQDIEGNFLSSLESGPFYINKSSSFYNVYYVVDDSYARNWVWQIEIDEYGYPVIAMVEINDSKTEHTYYAVKWNDYGWTKTFLANAGGHFHQTPGLELCYSGGLTIDPDNPNVFYGSVPVDGAFGTVYEIAKFTLDENGSNLISTEYITQNSRKNNVRPFVIPGSKDSDLRLAWMYGEYYDWIVSSTRPKGFPTEIHTDFKLPLGTVEFENGLILSDDFEGDVEGSAYTDEGALVVTEDTYAEFKTSSQDEFSITLTPYIDNSNYGGKILEFGNVTYNVDKNTLKPFVKVGNTIYESSNVLANSDAWKNLNRNTGGEYAHTLYKFMNLTLTYDGSNLKVYVNGLLDQNIEVSNLSLNSLKVGGFDGWVEDLFIHDRVINQVEMKSVEISDDAIRKSELRELKVPSVVTTDLVFPTVSYLGNEIVWTTSNEDLVTNDGLVNLPDEETSVTITATIGDVSRVFEVVVAPRNIQNNLILNYKFEEADVYEKGGTIYVKDKSGNGNDATLHGNAIIDGTLNLTANMPDMWDTNGYAMAPSGVLNDVRSYTFVSKVKLDLDLGMPRIFDFGTGSNYSVFLRAKNFSAGIKVDSTQILDAYTQIGAGFERTVAVTYDAKTKLTTIYLDGEVVGSGTSISHEVKDIIGSGTERNYIGRTQWHDVYKDVNYDLTGNIDDFYMFNIALTQEEIIALEHDALVTTDVEIAPDKVVVTIQNNSEEDINNAKVYVAVYEGNTLKFVESASVDSILALSEEEVSLDINVYYGEYVKVFLWDDNMQPIVEHYKKSLN